MFKRLIYDNWVTLVPLISFTLTCGTFIFFCIRAYRMQETERKHMSELPLEKD